MIAGGFWQCDIRQLHQHDARGEGYAFAKCDGLSRAKRWQEPQQAISGVGNGGFYDLLVAFVRQAHGEDGAALRQYGWIQVTRPLAHNAQRDAVFTPFLGNAGDNPFCWFETNILLMRHITMRFLAHEGDGQLAFAPQGQIEGEPRQD